MEKEKRLRKDIMRLVKEETSPPEPEPPPIVISNSVIVGDNSTYLSPSRRSDLAETCPAVPMISRQQINALAMIVRAIKRVSNVPCSAIWRELLDKFGIDQPEQIVAEDFGDAFSQLQAWHAKAMELVRNSRR